MNRSARRALDFLVVVLALAVLALGWNSPADARPSLRHVGHGEATCSGVNLEANAYDATMDNRWSIVVRDHATRRLVSRDAGTFGESTSQYVDLPQVGMTLDWVTTVEASDGGYRYVDSGTVGPCGHPPLRAHFSVTSYCNGVFLESRSNARVTKTRLRPGVFRFDGVGIGGATFGNGTDHRTIVRHVKRTGCHSSS